MSDKSEDEAGTAYGASSRSHHPSGGSLNSYKKESVEITGNANLEDGQPCAFPKQATARANLRAVGWGDEDVPEVLGDAVAAERPARVAAGGPSSAPATGQTRAQGHAGLVVSTQRGSARGPNVHTDGPPMKAASPRRQAPWRRTTRPIAPLQSP